MSIRSIIIGMAMACGASAQGAWYITEGVTEGDYVNSARFYDSDKGYYWHAGYIATNKARPLWEQTGGYEFLGYLEQRVTEADKAKEEYSTTWHSNAQLTQDRNTCWSQASINVLQYWQSYYGVFAADKEALPYGYTYDRQYLETLGGTQSVKLGMAFYDNFENVGGYFHEATDWYLQGETPTRAGLLRTEPLVGAKPEEGGYYGVDTGYFVDYFGEATVSNSAAKPEVYTYRYASADLVNVLRDYMGYEQVNGRWEQTTKGQIAFVCVETASEYSYTDPHAMTCYGFEVDDAGNLKSLLLTNSDLDDTGQDPVYGAFKVYVGPGPDYNLYRDEACTEPWTYGRDTWRLFYVSAINTPQELKDMYAQYVSEETALEWTGKLSEWTADNKPFKTDALPDEQTGWEVYVDAGNEPHDGYYATYYDAARVVEFGKTGAEGKSVRVNGTVKAAGMVLSADAEGYTFTGADTQALIDLRDAASVSLATVRSVTNTPEGGLIKTGTATDIIQDLNVAATYVSINAGNLKLMNAELTADSGVVKSGATLTLNRATAHVTAMTLEDGATLAIEGPSAIDGVWTLMGDVTLQMTLAEDMEKPLLEVKGSLALAEGAKITLELVNMDSLLGGARVNLFSFDQENMIDLSRIQVTGGELALENGMLSFTYHPIPEPTTTTLSILVLAGLCARRGRRTY